MTTAIAPTSNAQLLPDAAQLRAMLEFADTLLKSGLLPPHIKSPQAAFAVIQKGRELNIPPLYALSNIVVISGKPTANSELLQALIYRAHGDEALRFVETSDQRAVLAYKRRGWARAETFAFAIEDAKRAGLLTNQTWQKYPGAMLRARAISAVARLAFADAIGGLYLSEELGAAVDVTGEGDVVLVGPPAESDEASGRGVDPATGEVTEAPAPRHALSEEEKRARHAAVEAAWTEARDAWLACDPGAIIPDRARTLPEARDQIAQFRRTAQALEAARAEPDPF